MNPSGGPIPPSKQPLDPFLEDPSVAPSTDSPKIVDVPCAIEVQSEVPLVPSANGVHSESHPCLATDGHSISTPQLIAAQREKPHSRASPYDRGSSVCSFCNVFGHSFLMCKKRPGIDVDPVPLPRAVNIPSSAVPTATGTVPVPVKVVETPAMVQEEDGFTIVNCKGKKKAVKLQNKKKQVVVRTNSIGQKPNQRSPTMSDELHNHSVGTAGSIKSILGFDFTRAVQGANVKTKKPPNQSPSTSLQPAGAASRSANRHPSLRLLQWMWSLPKLHRATGLQL
ncbi:hypothetical protein L1987_07750 [Smallanthus sonchifolius]|uniref:Uncharacterized protein n=1 Tax=Smallanthus sonchifolius TaxID=185202 RepID=A0ACB9JIN5_9ASTR|nr:hypothetical protein L1987_07750 [Smallanthus sonchifolius]